MVPRRGSGGRELRWWMVAPRRTDRRGEHALLEYFKVHIPNLVRKFILHVVARRGPRPLFRLRRHGSNLRLSEERVASPRVHSTCPTAVDSARPRLSGREYILQLSHTGGTREERADLQGADCRRAVAIAWCHRIHCRRFAAASRPARPRATRTAPRENICRRITTTPPAIIAQRLAQWRWRSGGTQTTQVAPSDD